MPRGLSWSIQSRNCSSMNLFGIPNSLSLACTLLRNRYITGRDYARIIVKKKITGRDRSERLLSQCRYFLLQTKWFRNDLESEFFIGFFQTRLHVSPVTSLRKNFTIAGFKVEEYLFLYSHKVLDFQWQMLRASVNFFTYINLTTPFFNFPSSVQNVVQTGTKYFRKSKQTLFEKTLVYYCLNVYENYRIVFNYTNDRLRYNIVTTVWLKNYL